MAGVLFGLSAWMPFTAIRYRWSRLLLAAAFLTPIAQYWWVAFFQLQRNGQLSWWLYSEQWFYAPPTQSALAVLAGLSIASGLRPKVPSASAL